MLYRRGWHEWVTGDWKRARADLERALALNEEVGPSWVTPYVHYGLGSLFFVEGDWPAAMQHLTRCIDAAERRGDVHVRWAAKSLMAERDLLEGRPQAVRERLEPLLDSAGLEEAGVTLLLAYLAQAHLAMGDAQKAEALIRRAAAHATDESYRPTRAEVRRIQGIIAAQQGRRDEAEQALDEALALTRAVRNPYAEARVLHACGLVDARKGDRQSAERRLQEAAAIFRRLGARTDLDQTESMLAAL